MAGTRWLPLEEVAPIPPSRPAGSPGGVRWSAEEDSARAEVAATVMAVAPPVPGAVAPPKRRLRCASTWKGSTVAVLAVAMVLAAAAGTFALRQRHSAGRQAAGSVAVPGTSLVVDKPEGWTEGPLDSAPAILSDLVDTATPGSGLFFAGAGGDALFVFDAPNSADLDTVPPVAGHIGAATVTGQAPFTHELGPARRARARGGDGNGSTFELDATYVITGGRIVVVGAVAEGTLDEGDVAAARTLLESLRHR